MCLRHDLSLGDGGVGQMKCFQTLTIACETRQGEECQPSGGQQERLGLVLRVNKQQFILARPGGQTKVY